jgi:SAM-dependent methyltransferase
MFFPEKIKNIKVNSKVLEVGPGGTPHPRSDMFLDLDPILFENEVIAGFQRGNAPILKTDKPIVYYDGRKMPFKKDEFDYVICSHVLEHVEDPASFISELYRIGKSGYIEFPTIFYDYLYDIPVHINFLNLEGNTIKYIRKDKTPLSYFKSVQEFFLASLSMGYSDIVDDLKPYMFQGFEWTKNSKIKIVEVSAIDELIPSLKLAPKVREQNSNSRLYKKVYIRMRKKIKGVINKSESKL